MRFILAFALAILAAAAPAQSVTNAFEKEIRAFESMDLTNPPPKGAVLFIGSSSIRLWKTLAEDFPEFQVINRGFGGSQIADSVFFADRIVVPYAPRAIVMYAGGNDVNAGKSPERVFVDFKEFVQVVRKKLPGTPVGYIAIAPNPARWAQVERVREANRLIREFSESASDVSFIDVFPHMLGADGEPRPDIFSNDRLHMNAQGYILWREIVGGHLNRLGADPATGARAGRGPAEDKNRRNGDSR